jgi:hypothetical protein
MIIHQLARVIANLAIALDFSNDTIDEDDIVNIIEQLAIDLQDLDGESRKILSDAFRHIAPEYEGEFREYVETMPDGFGIE